MRYRSFTYLLFVITLTAFAGDECTGAHRGEILTRQQVIQLQKDQQSNLNLCGTDLEDVDLSNLHLTGINFSGADLSRANLSNTRFNQANLQQAYLRGAKLSGAIFFQANLSSANLQESSGSSVDFRQANLEHADLNGASLEKANLIRAKLSNAFIANADLNAARFDWADLSEAEFEETNLMNASFERANCRSTNFIGSNLTNAEFLEADLTGALLRDVILKDTRFFGTDFRDALYQPKLNQLPDLLLLVHAKNFNKIRFHHQHGMPALAQLRSAYEGLKLRKMERLITSMIKIKQMEASFVVDGVERFEAVVQYFLFYLPSDYGADPSRPLKIFLLLLFLMAIPYAYAIKQPTRTSGLLVKWSAQALQTHQQMMRYRLSSQRPSAPYHPLRNRIRVIRIALYFSVLSAFQMGWREWNVSNWIARVQGREYYLLSLGWVRVIAGIQSIISAYLLVLWLVTYFGRPFEW